MTFSRNQLSSNKEDFLYTICILKETTTSDLDKGDLASLLAEWSNEGKVLSLKNGFKSQLNHTVAAVTLGKSLNLSLIFFTPRKWNIPYTSWCYYEIMHVRPNKITHVRAIFNL